MPHRDHDLEHSHNVFDLPSRRAILLALGAAAAGSVASGAALAGFRLPGMKLSPTPGVDLVAEPGAHALPTPLVATQNDILGPFWRAGAPQRSNLVPDGAPGQRLILTGKVSDTDARPIEGVVMDFWNADAAGLYDLKSPNQAITPEEFRFRGILLSGADGRYEVETIVPGKYGIPPRLTGFDAYAGVMRPSHLHLMTSHAVSVPLITQIYFEGDPDIARDPWAAKSRNIVRLDKSGPVWRAAFDVVLVRYGAG